MRYPQQTDGTFFSTVFFFFHPESQAISQLGTKREALALHEPSKWWQ